MLPLTASAPALGDADWSLPAPPERPPLRGLEADRAIRAIACTRPHPLVTTGEILAAGVGISGISSRSATGFMHAVHEGVWKVGPAPLPAPGAWLAAVLACSPPEPLAAGPPSAALSHRTAAAHLGLVREDRLIPSVTVLGSGESARRARIAVHTALTLDPAEVTDHAGIPCLTPARVLLDLAAAGDPTAAARLLREGEYRGVLRRSHVGSLAERSPHRRGIDALLRAAAATPVPSGLSFPECLASLLALLESAGLPAPEVGAWLRTPDGHWVRPDLVWPRQRAVLELDPPDGGTDPVLRRLDGWRARQYRFAHHRLEHVASTAPSADPDGTLRRIEALLGGRR